MIEKNKTKTNTVTLDIELQDLLDIVSKSGSKALLSNETTAHIMEGEDLKKAWFKHVLINIEKLADLIETVRRVDMGNLRTELKNEIDNLEKKLEKYDTELKQYKKDVIDPLNNKVLTITIKLGIWSVIAGFFGSGIMAIIVYIIKEHILTH
jgi:hypothetical protein